MRKRLSLLLMAVLAVLSLSAPTMTFAHHEGCYDTFGVHRWVGNTLAGSTNALGARAYIAVPGPSVYDECTSDTGWGNDSVSSWVAVTGTNGDSNAIVQIGLTNCNEFSSACNWIDSNTPRFFYAAGGCGYSPIAADLGRAYPSTGYRFTAVKVNGADPYIGLYIDGSLQKKIFYTDPQVSCWINNDKDAQWYTETHDAGDNVGGASSNQVAFSGIEYSNGVWNSRTPNCTYIGPTNTHDPFGCVAGFNVNVGGWMNHWSTSQ